VSIRLWIAAFACSTSLFFVLSWIPKLATDLGLGGTQATFVGIIYNVGAWAGTLAAALSARRRRPTGIIGIFLTGGAALLLVLRASAGALPSMLPVVLLIGFCMQGGYNGLPGLAAAIYPIEARSTGIGWTIGMGRGGAIIGPLLGGMLLGAGLTLPAIFAIFSLPLLCAAVILAVKTSMPST
jgi:MFS family permease